MVTCAYCGKVCQRRHLKEHTKSVHKYLPPKEKIEQGQKSIFLKSPSNFCVEPLTKKQKTEENDIDSESDHNNSITES